MDKQDTDYTELLDYTTMTLSTADPDGQPHAAPVYFAAQTGPLRLYFFSDPSSQHIQDAMASQRAAAAIYPACYDYQDIRGLQLHGLVRLVERGAEWDLAWDLYQAKFPFVRHLKPVVARNSLYVFSPSWVRLVDNRRGFGFKQEWRLSP